MRPIHTLSDDHVRTVHALLEAEWWSRGRTLDEVRRCVAASTVNLGLVDDADGLVAYARVLTDFVFKAVLFDVVVAPAHRGSGVGRALLQSVLSYGPLREVQHLELYCAPGVAPFYEGFRFEEVGGLLFMRRAG